MPRDYYTITPENMQHLPVAYGMLAEAERQAGDQAQLHGCRYMIWQLVAIAAPTVTVEEVHSAAAK